MKLSPTFARRSRKVFFFIHLWTGLLLGLWFVLIGLTGSLLAWMPELITKEVNSKLSLQAPPAGATFVSLSKALDAMKAESPEFDVRKMSSVRMPTGLYPYYIAMGRDKKTNVTSLYIVEPVSGKAIPRASYDNLLMAKVIGFHVQLLAGIPGFIGNSVFSLFALFMLISGIWLWWPSNLKQLKQRLSVGRGVSLKRTFYDLHNVLGIYFYGLLFLTTFTAVIMCADTITRGGLEKAIDKRAGVTVVEEPKQVKVRDKALDRDVLMAKLNAAIPDVHIDQVRFPAKPDAPMQAAFFLSRNGFLASGMIWLDPYTGQVLKLERDNASSPGHKTVHLMQDLHFGWFGGIWSKVLYTIAGVVPVGLFITGIWMWLHRKRGQRRLKAKSKAELEKLTVAAG